MSDLKRYVKDRKERDPEFAAGYRAGYRKFRMKVLSEDTGEKQQGS